MKRQEIAVSTTISSSSTGWVVEGRREEPKRDGNSQTGKEGWEMWEGIGYVTTGEQYTLRSDLLSFDNVKILLQFQLLHACLAM